MKAGLLASLRRLASHLSARRRSQFLLLLGLMLFSAFAEVLSLGTVLPFLAVLASPDTLWANPIGRHAAGILNATSPDQMLLPLTLFFVTAALLSGALRLLLLWASSRLGLAAGADMSLELYRRTLYQPYQVHVARNSSEVISGITNKVDTLVGLLMSLLTLAASAVLIVAIMGALLAINPTMAMVAAVGFGLSYTATAIATRRRIRRNSERIARDHVKIVKAVQEGLGGIRDVLLDGTQPLYTEIYQRADRPFRAALAQNTFASHSPRYLMESLGIVLIASLAYGLTAQSNGIGSALPMLGALALGAQRLLPALQQAYSSWISLAGGQSTLVETLDLLDQPLPAEATQPAPDPLPFEHDIELSNIRFRYGDQGPWVLDGLQARIPKGARVGVVGSTGSGKSTVIDVLMGLLTPAEGELRVDGVPVTGPRVRAWQRDIAHVPQAIYLADSTIAENIAFGIPLEQIDMERVRRAAQHAQLANFVEQLPGEYRTPVGERGVRLSGGQRQRIGIARALYKQAPVLVFDEATSALDNVTERSVIDAIEDLGPDYTMVIIAHRLTTVRHCDLILELENGRVVAQGTYDELLERSAGFRRLASATTSP